jgi:hypothetical protein
MLKRCDDNDDVVDEVKITVPSENRAKSSYLAPSQTSIQQNTVIILYYYFVTGEDE